MIQRIDGLNDKVNDLLLYVRPRAPQVRPIELPALLTEAASAARAATGDAGPPVAIQSPDGVRVLADPDMLRPALLNLIMNAYQSGGRAPIEIGCLAESGRCRLTISDRGAGIPDHIRERVFEPFFTTRTNGTGLGLAVVRRLIELQEGTVALYPREGGGTVVEVTLPIGPSL